MTQPNPYEAPQEPITETIRKKRFPIKRFVAFLVLLVVFIIAIRMWWMVPTEIQSLPTPKTTTSNP